MAHRKAAGRVPKLCAFSHVGNNRVGGLNSPGLLAPPPRPRSVPPRHARPHPG